MKSLATSTLIVLLIVFAIPSEPAAARPGTEDIQVTGTFGFGGYFKIQTPAPLIFTVTNSGKPINGWALANLESWVPPTFYTHPLVVPQGGSQRVEMGCYGCMSGNPCAVPLEIYAADGAMLQRESLDSYLLGRYDTLLVHLGDPSSSLENLKIDDNPGLIAMAKAGVVPEVGQLNYPSKVYPVILQSRDLPSNSLLCDGVGLIAMDISAFIALSQDIRDMLLGYVRHGGNLLVYFRDGVDPLTGWTSDLLLPVSPLGSRAVVQYDDLARNSESLFPQDYFKPISSPHSPDYVRGMHGEFIRKPRPSDDNLSTEVGETGTVQQVSVWIHPDSYPVISVSPGEYTETFNVGDMAVLVVRLTGSGHVGFAAFDPFAGNPASADLPISLLAFYGLLDPFSPSARLISDTMSSLPIVIDAGDRDFFNQPVKSSEYWFLRWMKAIGLPVLIYLLGLPLLAIISRGRGQIALMLFIAWSIAMTAMTMYRRNLPVPDRARISEADLLWCEALPPSETDSRNAGETRLSSVFSYSAETPAPRSIAFQAADAMLDEIVNPNTWPYGSVTIGEGSEARLPDLPLEPVMVGTEKIVSRTFTCRRTMPELTATGLLTVTPSSAHLTLDATLPFSATAGLMFVQSKVMTVRKDLGRTDGSMHFDTDLVEGTEINRQEGLLKKQNDYNRENRPWVPPSPPDEGIEGVLRSFWGTVSSIAVSRGQQYTMSRVTGRPGRAYVLIASKAIPTRITVDRGTLEQNAITVAVISLPIVYEDFPD